MLRPPSPAFLALNLPKLECNGCRDCCIGERVPLVPGDDPSKYKTQLTNGSRHLKVNSEGNCVFLGNKGCKLYDDKVRGQPIGCKRYDCREHAFEISRMPEEQQKRRRFGDGVRRGVERLREHGVEVSIHGINVE